MPTLQAADFADLMTTSLRDLGRLKWTDISSDYQDTIALKRLVRNKKTTFDSGPEIQFNLQVDTGRSARFVGMAAPDVVNIVPTMTTGQVPWRHVTWNWGMEFREPLMNSGASKIVDLIKTRRIAEFGGAVKLFENAFWRAPASTDTTTPYGIPYYVVKSNTAATKANNDGFNGTVPSGYTTVATLSPTTYTRWRNYATQYTAVSKDDLVKKMRRAMFKTRFMPLVADVPEYDLGGGFGLYTNYEVVATMEEILESQNENLGNDLASMDGKAVFRRTEVTPVVELELDTTNPVYGLNWDVLATMGLRGAWMKETVEAMVGGQHTVSATHTDCTYNTVCYNRRRNFVLATDTTMSY